MLGLDFDNTLVRYDTLFHQLALEKNLIDSSVAPDKITIRDYLRAKGQEEDFTLLQGEVYGRRILEASPAEGMLEALIKIKELNIPIVIVSHKTRYPYKGERYDLHLSALKWLREYGFFELNGIGMQEDQVYFETTKEKKATRVRSLGCNYFLDDLPEILALLHHEITSILYDPGLNHPGSSIEKRISHWSQLPKIIKYFT